MSRDPRWEDVWAEVIKVGSIYKFRLSVRSNQLYMNSYQIHENDLHHTNSGVPPVFNLVMNDLVHYLDKHMDKEEPRYGYYGVKQMDGSIMYDKHWLCVADVMRSTQGFGLTHAGEWGQLVRQVDGEWQIVYPGIIHKFRRPNEVETVLYPKE